MQANNTNNLLSSIIVIVVDYHGTHNRLIHISGDVWHLRSEELSSLTSLPFTRRFGFASVFLIAFPQFVQDIE